MYACMCAGMHIWLWIRTPVVSGPPPPSVTSLRRGRLFQTLCRGFLVAMIINIVPPGKALYLGVCRGGVCRKTPPPVTNLCREMAAQACFKTYVFDSLPYMYTQQINNQIHM